MKKITTKQNFKNKKELQKMLVNAALALMIISTAFSIASSTLCIIYLFFNK